MSFKINFFKLFLILLLVCLPAVVTLIFIDNLGTWAFPSNKDRVGEVFKTLLSVYGGFVLFFGLYVSYLRAKEAKRAVDKQTEVIQNQSREIELTRDSHISEQFKTAVEHLGSDREPVILGGVAELNDVSTKYKEVYAEVVSDIFCSYIRSEAMRTKHATTIRWSVVQTIIKNLCHNEALKDYPVDLRKSNLSEIEISDCHLKNWNLSNSNLPYQMIKVNFENSLFHNAKVFNSKYDSVSFTDCELISFFIQDGFWKGCKIQGMQDFSPSALNSLFRDVSFLSPNILGTFHCCLFDGSDFGDKIQYIVDFSTCSFKNITFKNELFDCNFNAAAFENVKVVGEVDDCSFKGVISGDYRTRGVIASILQTRSETFSDFSGIDLPLKIERNQSFLDVEGVNEIVNSYNHLLSLGRSQGKKIAMLSSLKKDA